jgi:hypothetical protein
VDGSWNSKGGTGDELFNLIVQTQMKSRQMIYESTPQQRLYYIKGLGKLICKCWDELDRIAAILLEVTWLTFCNIFFNYIPNHLQNKL